METTKRTRAARVCALPDPSTSASFINSSGADFSRVCRAAEAVFYTHLGVRVVGCKIVYLCKAASIYDAVILGAIIVPRNWMALCELAGMQYHLQTPLAATAVEIASSTTAAHEEDTELDLAALPSQEAHPALLWLQRLVQASPAFQKAASDSQQECLQLLAHMREDKELSAAASLRAIRDRLKIHCAEDLHRVKEAEQGRLREAQGDEIRSLTQRGVGALITDPQLQDSLAHKLSPRTCEICSSYFSPP
jgi:hypothetical protein